MEPVNTYKGGGNSLQKMYFYLGMLFIFPPEAALTIDCDGTGD